MEPRYNTHDRSSSVSELGVVLVVEDDDDIRETIECILTEEGYRVLTVSDGKGALDELAVCAELPAVILLDLTMPRMNGHVLAGRLRVDPRLAHIPVVAMSAINDFDAQVASMGAAWGLRKPLDLKDLLAVIARYARHPRT